MARRCVRARRELSTQSMTDHPERCSLGARERQSSFQLGLQDPVFSGQILIPAGAAPGPPYGKLFARLGSFDHLVFTAGKTLQLGSLATYRWCPAGITARLFSEASAFRTSDCDRPNCRAIMDTLTGVNWLGIWPILRSRCRSHLKLLTARSRMSRQGSVVTADASR